MFQNAVAASITVLLPLFAIPPAEADADRALLESVGITMEGDGSDLLEYLHRQTVCASDPAKLQQIIQQLGDDDFATREKASAELIALGQVALSLLQKAAAEQKGKDAEVAHRAQQAIQRIREGSSAALPAAVLRQLARRKPAGTAAQVLEYVPHAPDEITLGEAGNTLAAVAVRDGKPDPVLMKALRDPQPRRRAAAAEALSKAHVAEARQGVRDLFKDPNIQVRLRVALALARLHEKDAIPVLIDLLAAAPAEQLLPVEDLLFQIAGKDAPTVSAGPREEERKQYRDAWLAWWNAHNATVDLAKLAAAAKPLGYTLIVLLDTNTIQELDDRNQPRWSIAELHRPLDVQLLPGNRLLVAERGDQDRPNGGNRVTERNLKGEIVWKKDVVNPIVAQRLPNGNTFIACDDILLECDREGKEVRRHTAPGGTTFRRAVKLPNGDIACVTSAGRFMRLDADGRTLNSFPVQVETSGGRVDVLHNGHVLIPEKLRGRVVEYDATGKPVWEVQVPEPVAAVRLPNGHTLITSMSTSHGAAEYDRQGKKGWEYSDKTSKVTRAFRR
jgi:hypothetical protein